MNPSQVRLTYDRIAPTYDKTVGFTERLFLGGLRRAFGAELRGKTLEVAVGTGLNLPYYSPAVTDSVGIDLSVGMLDAATARARELDRTMTFAQMDAMNLAFTDRQFDTVAISLALCTVPDPVAALQELIRVCRPDGRIVLLEHVLSPVWPVAALERLFTPLQERSLGCHLTRQTLKTARHVGLTIESERSRFFGVFRLAVARPPQQ